MAIVSRGPNFQATFLAAATLSTMYQPVYISASGTVAAVTTQTNVAIGTVSQKSTGGALSAVGVDMFIPSRVALAGGTVSAGGRVMISTGTATYVDAAGTSSTVQVAGIAVNSATDSGEHFELIPMWAADQIAAF